MKITATFDSLEEFENFTGRTTLKKEATIKKTVEEPQEEVKEEKQATSEFTLEDVRAKLGQLQKAGKKDVVKELLNSFGASKLPEVSPDDYAELMRKAGEA